MTDERNVASFTEEQLLLTPEQAALVLRIGRTKVFALMKSGQLRAVHIGRTCRISRAELDRYVRRLEAQNRPTSIERARSRRSAPKQDGALFELDPDSPDAA